MLGGDIIVTLRRGQSTLLAVGSFSFLCSALSNLFSSSLQYYRNDGGKENMVLVIINIFTCCFDIELHL